MKTKRIARDIGISWNVLSDHIEGFRINDEKVLRRALDYLTTVALQVKHPPTLDTFLNVRRLTRRFNGHGPFIVIKRPRRQHGAAS